jgi:hypothetical protein
MHACSTHSACMHLCVHVSHWGACVNVCVSAGNINELLVSIKCTHTFHINFTHTSTSTHTFKGHKHTHTHTHTHTHIQRTQTQTHIKRDIISIMDFQLHSVAVALIFKIFQPTVYVPSSTVDMT